MRRTLIAAAAAAGLLWGPSPPPLAAATTDVGGVWIFRIARGRGTVALNLGVPSSGTFTVRGAGFSRRDRAYFAVDDDAPQTLSFQPNGSIRGTVAVEDLALEADLGTLEIRRGRLGPSDQHLTLVGRLTLGGLSRRVRLNGVRRPAPVPDRSGGSFDGRVIGRGLRSAKLGVALAKSDRHAAMGLPGGAEDLGHPFYELACTGPVRVGGAVVQDFALAGLLLSDQKDEVRGRVSTSQFGPATVDGRFTFTDPAAPGRPVLHAHVRPDEGPLFHVRALLLPDVAPN